MGKFLKLSLIVLVILFEVFVPANSCEYHRRLEEARRKAEAARLKRLQEQTIAETRANLAADGYVNAGPKTSLNHHQHHSQAPKRPTPVKIQLTGLGNNQGAYNRIYNTGQSRGQQCPGTNYFCPVGRQCVLKGGSYRCELPTTTNCPVGFQRIDISSTQFRCEDINECEDEELNDCEHVCKNLYGSYRCECPPGFKMGEEGCEDINECSQAYPVCQHECINTDGSYECVCPDGYELQGETRCQDVNECDTKGACSGNSQCLNLYGGYECNSPEPCEEGYERSGSNDFGPCVIEDYSQAHGYSKPFSIIRSRFAIHSGYQAGAEVAKLKFHRSRGHHYRYELESGIESFSIQRITQHGQNMVVVRTTRKLMGPALHEVTILIYDTNLRNNYGVTNNSYMNRVELSFVVSPYTF